MPQLARHKHRKSCGRCLIFQRHLVGRESGRSSKRLLDSKVTFSEALDSEPQKNQTS